MPHVLISYFTSLRHYKVQQKFLYGSSAGILQKTGATVEFRYRILFVQVGGVKIERGEEFVFQLFYRKTDNKQDTCLVAQEKLHPVCAQRIEGQAQPTCLSLAANCKENEECRLGKRYDDKGCIVNFLIYAIGTV